MTIETKNEFAQYLEFCNLQVASEAFLVDKNDLPNTILSASLVDQNLINKLVQGNEHSSKFTDVQAADFASKWEVVAHKGNTNTGFSGTLFKAKVTIPGTGIVEGQYVISFRSTEFIEDSIHDNRATNTLEIKEKGWAFGQIADMEQWFSEIKSKIDGPLSVTGYSLGGHLATAFNILHHNEKLISDTYTFNGAGVGKIVGASNIEETKLILKDLISEFSVNKERSVNDSVFTSRFTLGLQGLSPDNKISMAKIYQDVSTLLQSIGTEKRKEDADPKIDDISEYLQRISQAISYLKSSYNDFDSISKSLLEMNDTLEQREYINLVKSELDDLYEVVTRVREMANEYV